MFIGIDVGGTKLEAVLIEHTAQGFNTISKLRSDTERDLGYEHIILRITELIQNLLKKNNTNLNSVKALGFGLPGSIDPVSNVMLLGNTHALENKPILEDIKKKLGSELPIFFENDANAFALAEVYLGAGLEYKKRMNKPVESQTAVGIILGTGVGGGVIVNGKVLQGRRGAGGEIGHTTLHDGDEAADCYCERKGCVEQYLSGPAVESQYKIATGKNLKASEIFSQTDSTSKKIVQTYKENLALFLGNLANILDPDYFVLGGGVSTQTSLYESIQDDIKKNLFVKINPPQVLKYAISDSSGSMGAALVAWKGCQ